jgi:hypothetical protein
LKGRQLLPGERERPAQGCSHQHWNQRISISQFQDGMFVSFLPQAQGQSAKLRASRPDAEARSDDHAWLWTLFDGFPTIEAGVAVGPLTALSVPAVRQAVEIIVGTMGTIPACLHREAQGRGKETAGDHPERIGPRGRERLDLSRGASITNHRRRASLRQRLRRRESGRAGQPKGI